MASAIIHIAIAKELENKLQIRNKREYYLGAIAPDISKQVGSSREDSHFLKNTKDEIPNIKLFTQKYPSFIFNEFDLGYYIHLYTDKLWIEDFLSNIKEGEFIRLLDGTTIKSKPNELRNLIYSDYTNLNETIIDEYNLDLSLFYEEFEVPKTKIKEIPIEKLDILINKMGILIENSKETKPYTFDIYTIKAFIEDATKKIGDKIDTYKNQLLI